MADPVLDKDEINTEEQPAAVDSPVPSSDPKWLKIGKAFVVRPETGERGVVTYITVGDKTFNVQDYVAFNRPASITIHGLNGLHYYDEVGLVDASGKKPYFVNSAQDHLLKKTAGGNDPTTTISFDFPPQLGEDGDIFRILLSSSLPGIQPIIVTNFLQLSSQDEEEEEKQSEPKEQKKISPKEVGQTQADTGRTAGQEKTATFFKRVGEEVAQHVVQNTKEGMAMAMGQKQQPAAAKTSAQKKPEPQDPKKIQRNWKEDYNHPEAAIQPASESAETSEETTIESEDVSAQTEAVSVKNSGSVSTSTSSELQSGVTGSVNAQASIEQGSSVSAGGQATIQSSSSALARANLKQDARYQEIEKELVTQQRSEQASTGAPSVQGGVTESEKEQVSERAEAVFKERYPEQYAALTAQASSELQQPGPSVSVSSTGNTQSNIPPSQPQQEAQSPQQSQGAGSSLKNDRSINKKNANPPKEDSLKDTAPQPSQEQQSAAGDKKINDTKLESKLPDEPQENIELPHQEEDKLQLARLRERGKSLDAVLSRPKSPAQKSAGAKPNVHQPSSERVPNGNEPTNSSSGPEETVEEEPDNELSGELEGGLDQPSAPEEQITEPNPTENPAAQEGKNLEKPLNPTQVTPPAVSEPPVPATPASVPAASGAVGGAASTAAKAAATIEKAEAVAETASLVVEAGAFFAGLWWVIPIAILIFFVGICVIAFLVRGCQVLPESFGIRQMASGRLCQIAGAFKTGGLSAGTRTAYNVVGGGTQVITGGPISVRQWSSQIIDASNSNGLPNTCVMTTLVAKESAGNKNAVSTSCPSQENVRGFDISQHSPPLYDLNWNCGHAIGLTQIYIFPNTGSNRWQDVNTPSRYLFTHYYTIPELADATTNLNLGAKFFSYLYNRNANINLTPFAQSLPPEDQKLWKAYRQYAGGGTEAEGYADDSIRRYQTCKLTGN